MDKTIYFIVNQQIFRELATADDNVVSDFFIVGNKTIKSFTGHKSLVPGIRVLLLYLNCYRIGFKVTFLM